MKKLAALLLALLTLVSCSEGDTGVSTAAPTAPASGEAGEGDKQVARTDEDDRRGSNRTRAPGDIGQGPADNGGDENLRDDSADPNGRGGRSRSGFNDSGREDDGSSAAFPSAGRYVYAQSGSERFCTGARCDRQALPKQQEARISVIARSDQGATVVTEASSSDDRILRTTTDYNRTNALITNVYTRLSYEGFAFENEYHPAPPVESLRFPLRDGAAWRGSWEDSTSGNYAVRVFGPTSVRVGGRVVRAFQVATTTRFKGEFKGEAKTLAWIDPATKVVVKLSGSADLTSTYGRYITEFSTALRSGPRY